MSAPLSMLRYAPSPALAAFRARAKLEATWWTKQLKRASVSDFLGGAPAVADADARQALDRWSPGVLKPRTDARRGPNQAAARAVQLTGEWCGSRVARRWAHGQVIRKSA